MDERYPVLMCSDLYKCFSVGIIIIIRLLLGPAVELKLSLSGTLCEPNKIEFLSAGVILVLQKRAAVPGMNYGNRNP